MEEIFASFQYGIPAAIIVAVYLIVNKIIDAKKDKRRAEINDSLVNSFTKLDKFFSYFTDDIIKKEQDKCEFAIKNSFEAFENSLLKFAITIIVNNDVENNRESIINNIKQIINTNYWYVYSCLILYKSGEERVSDYLEQVWKEELEQDMVNIIFDSKKSKEQRVYNINNKIHLDVDSHCVHVLNKYATHKK